MPKMMNMSDKAPEGLKVLLSNLDKEAVQNPRPIKERNILLQLMAFD